MDLQNSVSDDLWKRHLELCEWAIQELQETEGNTPSETASYDETIEILMTASGYVVPQELYGWLQRLLPEELETCLLAEARRLKWPDIPVNPPVDEQEVGSKEALMRDHKDWDALRICLHRMWDEKQNKGIVPLESSGNLVIAHIGLRPFSEAMSMAAERLHQTVDEIVSAWDKQKSKALPCKITATARSRVWKPGVLKLRKQTELQNL